MRRPGLCSRSTTPPAAAPCTLAPALPDTRSAPPPPQCCYPRSPVPTQHEHTHTNLRSRLRGEEQGARSVDEQGLELRVQGSQCRGPARACGLPAHTGVSLWGLGRRRHMFTSMRSHRAGLRGPPLVPWPPGSRCAAQPERSGGRSHNGRHGGPGLRPCLFKCTGNVFNNVSETLHALQEAGEKWVK